MEICKLLLGRMKKLIAEIEFQFSQEEPKFYDKVEELERLGNMMTQNFEVWWNPED